MKRSLDRRFQRYLISPEVMIFREGVYTVVENALPEDAIECGVNYESESGMFSIRIWSASFDLVPEGGLIPIAKDTFIKYRKKKPSL